MPNATQRKPAIEQEQVNTVVNHREYPAPLTQIADETYSVVVIGAGPAGLMLSSSLARLGGGNGAMHSVLTVDLRTQPTEAGRADGEFQFFHTRSVRVATQEQFIFMDLHMGWANHFYSMQESNPARSKCSRICSRSAMIFSHARVPLMNAHSGTPQRMAKASNALGVPSLSP